METTRILTPSSATLCALAALFLAPLAPLCAEDPPQPVATDEAAARQRAVLLESFKSLEDELKAVLPEYTKALQAAKAKNLPHEEWPKAPANDFYPRFESLALQDQPDALRWCIGVMPSIDLTMDLRNSKRDALYRRYVATCIDEAYTLDIIGFLGTEGNPTGLGVERAVPLLDKIAAGGKPDEVRVKALWTKAQLYAKSDKPEHAPLTIASYRVIMTLFPTRPEAGQARDIVFQLENLAVGMTAPDFTTTDIDGKPLKLSDSRGKVTVLLFFSFGHRATPQMLPLFKDLAQTFQGKPFTILGVAGNEKLDEVKKGTADAGVTWKTAWHANPAESWATQWGITRLPAVFVLDQQGVIRFVNLEPRAIKSAVAEMLNPSEKKPDPPK